MWLNFKKILGKLKNILAIIFENSQIIQKSEKLHGTLKNIPLKEFGKNMRQFLRDFQKLKKKWKHSL